MNSIVIIILLVAISAQVFPVALGFNIRGKVVVTATGSLILILSQVLLFWIGLSTGSSFMYLLSGFDKAVLFIGFLLLAVRFLMEVFKIRKGDRTYQLDSIMPVLLASLAQGINTFLLGIILSLITIDVNGAILVLAISSTIFSLLGVIMKAERLGLSLASLFYLLSGLVILFSGAYFTFI